MAAADRQGWQEHLVKPAETCPYAPGNQMPDLDSEAFKAECRRQSLLVAEADAADPDLADWLNAAWADLCAMSEWKEPETDR